MNPHLVRPGDHLFVRGRGPWGAGGFVRAASPYVRPPKSSDLRGFYVRFCDRPDDVYAWDVDDPVWEEAELVKHPSPAVFAWNGGAVRKVMDECRSRFSLLPLLADALEDAGYNDYNLLNELYHKNQSAYWCLWEMLLRSTL